MNEFVSFLEVIVKAAYIRTLNFFGCTAVLALVIGVGCKPRKPASSVKAGEANFMFSAMKGGSCSTSGQSADILAESAQGKTYACSVGQINSGGRR